MGHLFCFDAASGKVLWNKDLNAEYKIRMPIWGIAASPLVENDLVIVQVGGEGACLVAFDKRTGAEGWRALDDNASYSAPIIDRAGRPARARLLDRRQRRGARSGDRQGLLEVSLQAGQDGHQHRHAGAR